MIRKPKNRKFIVSDKVLILLPLDHKILLMQGKGPYEIESVVSSIDYKVNVPGKVKPDHA